MWRAPFLAALVLVSSTFDAGAGSLFSSGGWGAQQGAAAPAAPPSRAAPSNDATVIRRMPVRTPASNTRSTAATVGSGVCEREIQAAAAKYGVPEGILYSVGLTETGRKGSLSAYAMNVEGKAYFPPSRQAAMTTFYDAKRQGMKLIDIGCMQINHYFHGENFSSPEEMFDPKRNVEYAAKFLRNLHDKHETWTMAVARYHAGPNNNPAQKQYVCRVISNLVATGYGEWTSNASRFCTS